MTDPTVRFEAAANRGGAVLAALEVRCSDRPGLATILVQHLFDLRVQIVRRERLDGGAEYCERLYVVEFDGARISPWRREQIELSLARSLGGALRLTRSEHHAA